MKQTNKVQKKEEKEKKNMHKQVTIIYHIHIIDAKHALTMNFYYYHC